MRLNRFIFLVISVFLTAHIPETLGQIHPGLVPSPYESISQNSISNMGALGDTLWIGPRMEFNINNEIEWRTPDGIDSVSLGRGRLFSIALAPDTVVAGIAYNDIRGDEIVQTQMGFYITTDGGLNWELIDTSRTLDNPGDMTIPYGDVSRVPSWVPWPERTVVRYGGQYLDAVPIIVPQQSPPFMVDFKGDVLFFAGWASGIRRSTDFGQTCERIVLPPFELDELHPEEDYDFVIDPRGDDQSNSFLNFLGFSVLIAADGKVYAGTAGGLNISDNALHAPADSIRWRHVRQWQNPDGLLGNWITSIRENPYDRAVWMSNWVSVTGQDREGLVVTRDAGKTFEQFLAGERIYDIGFDRETIIAAGRNGVFISSNNGSTWQRHSRIESANTFIKPDAEYYSVATTNSRVWIGSSDGLASTADGGDSWEITRVNFPLSGGNKHESDAPEVDAYAYPNPFSPQRHDLVRIKFDNPNDSEVTIRLFDFSMNLIRILDEKRKLSPGTYEAVWDGTDQQGRRVANGTVFYEVNTGKNRTVGKILLLE